MYQLNDKAFELKKIFILHMLWEYPQIDENTREALATELAVITAVL